MAKSHVTRRKLLQTTALGVAAAVAAPYVKGAYAAGSLSIGFWDHWVPGANDTMTKPCNEWAKKEHVDVKIDYITSQGSKDILTAAAEYQAKSGHDSLQMSAWQPLDKADELEPLDDVMKDLIAANGKVSEAAKYLGNLEGHWVGVPQASGSQTKPPLARISYLKKFADLDVQKMYPVGAAPDSALADKWTWDTFLAAAEKCFKAGKPFGLGLGQTSDSVDWVGSVFASHGAVLVNEKGDITVKSDATKQVLEWFKKLVAVLPQDVFAYDDASNNKWLIGDKGSLIMNPPSAWAVAKRDNPAVASDCWSCQSPKGPKGRYTPSQPYFQTVWKFSKNKSAAKSLIRYISSRSAIEQLVAASVGYDIPAFANLLDFDTWKKEEPPRGIVYNYPPRGDTIESIAAAPAPPKIAVQIYVQATMTKMINKCTQGGESIDAAIAWASSELEGFMRT
jgi:ABC-type glycerol-3-phosphate transport system substrate-binding protein